VITLGVDFAAQPERTAACFVHWEDGRAEANELELGVDDAQLRVLISRADKVGLDVPLGWPEAFVNSVAAHQRKDPWPVNSIQKLCFRETDQFIKEKTGKWPLSVSTDRIGVTALRAAALIDATNRETQVDRTGRGKLVEVYPAAALRRWGLKPLPRKESGKLAIAVLQRTSSWLHLAAEVREIIEANRDALDALVASLVARAAAVGLCEPIPEELVMAASTEGWIALPRPDSLEQLASP